MATTRNVQNTNNDDDLYKLPSNININGNDYDTYANYITYLNNQIDLYRGNESPDTAAIVGRLVNNRDMLLRTLNEMYDKNTDTLDLKYKLNSNDDYIKAVQDQQIVDNNQKINNINSDKMNKTRLHEIKEYETELKRHRIRYLFWSLMVLVSLIVILLCNIQFNIIFNNLLCVILSITIFIMYIVYLVIDIAFNYRRSKRFYSKFDFDTPPYTEESNGIVITDSCPDGYNTV